MIRAASFMLFLALSLQAPLALAQGLPGSDPLSLVINPSYPRPYSTITISPRSSLIDLSASNVEILVNGASIYQGSGTQGVVARVGGLGERTTILLKVTDPSGQVYTKQAVLRPAEVSLVLEPISTTHALYKGGGLVASEGRIRLIAVPDLRNDAGVRLPEKSLVYTWRFGDRILTDQSGIGKSILVATAPVRYRNADITLTVTSPDSSLVGEAKTTISAVDPIARIYQNDPLLGPNFDIAVSKGFSLPDTEATFRAVGYFFAVPPTLTWTVNGTASGSDKDITVRVTDGRTGTARLGLSADERSHYQFAGTDVSLSFGEGGGLGIFGL